MLNKIMRFTRCLLPCCCFCIYLTPNLSLAQQYTGPVAMGLGNAGVASAETVESTFLNPASLAHSESFSAAVFYRDGYSYGVNHVTDYGVNFVDNTPGVMVPGSVGFLQRRRTFIRSAAINEKLWHVSLGNFVAPQLSAGLSLYYSDADTAGEEFSQVNGNMGFMWNPSPDWALGLTIFNLRSIDPDIPESLRYYPKFLLGFNFIATRFVRMRIDTGKQLEANSNNRWEVKGGLESFLGEFVVFRLGWESDQLRERDLMTAGLSFIGPRFHVDYAIQKSQEDGERGALHSVDLNVPF